MVRSHYFKTKLVKLGRWNLFPADTEAWHGEFTSLKYFKKVFGFNKCLLMILHLDDGSQFPYAPASLIKKLYRYIERTNQRDYKALEKKLLRFYSEKKKSERIIQASTPHNCKKLSTKELISAYQKNRDVAHRIAVYDQFGWLAEDYWNPVMENILVKKCGLTKDSPEYFEALFALTKPEAISTTLKEERDVIFSCIKIQRKKTSIESEAKKLTRLYGWLPVFAFGEPWDENHYMEELKALKNLKILEKKYLNLKNYTRMRNRDIEKLVEKYKIQPRDLQIFIDFGLTLDARNEAEYVQSLCGFYLRPIYFEIARRLYVSIRQLRCLYESEIVDCLRGKKDPLKLLEQKGKITAFGFDKAETIRVNYSTSEARELFEYLEGHSTLLHGHNDTKGLCASPGLARGKVKVVTSPANNDKVTVGDIMLAEATTVDYLPAMKRAGAIVTELGSLTCHAAVVSREFGLPCIVGLKDVTKNFKDGDMVEVRANEGRILRI